MIWLHVPELIPIFYYRDKTQVHIADDQIESRCEFYYYVYITWRRIPSRDSVFSFIKYTREVKVTVAMYQLLG